MNLSTAEALRVFLDEKSEKRTELLTFVGATRDRIPDWLKSKGPVGIYLLKLRVYLMEQGFTLSECRKMDEEVKILGRSIAHGLVTVEDVMKDTKLCKEHVYAVLLGRCGISEEKLEVVSTYNETSRKLLKPIKDRLAKEASQLPPPKQVVVGERITLDQEAALTWLASCIVLVIPIAQYLASDKCSPEQRNAFRRQVGSQALFDATNGLNALTSETTREMMRRR